MFFRNFVKKFEHSSQIEILLLASGLLIGLLFCIFIPYGAGFDEETHLVRILDISHLRLIPNQEGNKTLAQFYMYSYQRRDFQSPAFDQFQKQIFFSKPVWDHLTVGTTRATYFPVIYLLPSIIAGLCWWLLRIPVLPTIILMRLVGFLFYLIASYLTWRILPIGKLVFLVLAISPTALFQAATLNADGFTNAVSYLFFGFLIKIFLDKSRPINIKETWILSMLILFTGFTKPGTILLFLLLILLSKNKIQPLSSKIIVIGSVFISIVVTIGWSKLAVINSPTGIDGRPLTDQLTLVFKNLPDFISVFVKGLFFSIGNYYYDWVGVYGYWVGKVPILTYIFYPIAIITAFLSEGRSPLLSKTARFSFFIISLFCLVAISSFIFVYVYQPGVPARGSQGRYFLPFMPIFFFAFTGLFRISAKYQKWAGVITLGFLFLTITTYSYGLYRTYYTKCVYGVSQSHPCTLPVYKNFDVENPYVAKITPEIAISQSFIPLCKELSSVILQVGSIYGNPDDKFVINISDESKDLVVSKEYSFSSIKENTFLNIPIHISNLRNRTILWMRIELTLDDSQGAEIGLLGRKDGSKYPDGVLLINKEVQNADLFFQYSCSAP